MVSVPLGKVRSNDPVRVSQIRMSPSSPPEASTRPPGWNARENAACLCRPNSLMSRPVAESQRRTVPSLLAEATAWPSGLYCTQVTVQDSVADGACSMEIRS